MNKELDKLIKKHNISWEVASAIKLLCGYKSDVKELHKAISYVNLLIDKECNE